MVIAALRQDRTYKPAADQLPAVPGPSGLTSEVPAPDYDVVVFENRFPSLCGAGASPFQLPTPDGAGFVSAPGHGRCEVICFSSNHIASFADLESPHARLVVDAWRHRTADLMARPGIEQVFCFENRGEEIGVTLTHPHGQIYGYPFLRRVRRRCYVRRGRTDAHGTNLFADLLAHELADGSRIIARTDLFTAFVPFAARWPVEVHIYPNRFVHNLIDLDDAELDGFARSISTCSPLRSHVHTPLPYMSALHQYTDNEEQGEGYFHVELMSIRRTATKLKYLAASESALDAFISDVTPKRRQRLRERDHDQIPGRRADQFLIGEHTDYNLGFALPIALPERTVVTLDPDQSDATTVSSDGVDGTVAIRLDPPGRCDGLGRLRGRRGRGRCAVRLLDRGGHDVGRERCSRWGRAWRRPGRWKCAALGAITSAAGSLWTAWSKRESRSAQRTNMWGPNGFAGRSWSHCSGSRQRALLIDFREVDRCPGGLRSRSVRRSLTLIHSRARHRHAGGEYCSAARSV